MGTVRQTRSINAKMQYSCSKGNDVCLVGSRRRYRISTITAVRYKQQLMKLNQALKKRPEYAKLHEKLISLHGKAPPHVAEPVKKYIQDMNRKVLGIPR